MGAKVGRVVSGRCNWSPLDAGTYHGYIADHVGLLLSSTSFAKRREGRVGGGGVGIDLIRFLMLEVPMNSNHVRPIMEV